MSQGKNIKDLVHNMQKLNEEIAALIKTFESLLSVHGFKCEGGNAVINEVSTSLQAPKYWTAPWMYRILKNTANRDDVIILNVALDAPDHPEEVQTLFEEPLVLCARFQYHPGKASEYVAKWDPWDLWVGKEADKVGQLYRIEPRQLDSEGFLALSEWSKDAIHAMQEIRFVAIPLVWLVDRKALEKEIVQRIL